MSAVGQNTFRGFRRVNKALSGAKEGFIKYLVQERASLASALTAVKSRNELHRLSNRICDAVRLRLDNIRPSQLHAFNKLRKPVDLYVEHLVAMATELDDARHKLVTLLFLPLDSQILAYPRLFSDEELSRFNLTRKSTYSDITSEQMYSAMQMSAVQRAESVVAEQRRQFYAIYFDLVWNRRYRNWGGNLFEVNP